MTRFPILFFLIACSLFGFAAIWWGAEAIVAGEIIAAIIQFVCAFIDIACAIYWAVELSRN